LMCGGQWGCEGRVGVTMVYDLTIAPVSLYAEPLTEARWDLGDRKGLRPSTFASSWKGLLRQGGSVRWDRTVRVLMLGG